MKRLENTILIATILLFASGASFMILTGKGYLRLQIDRDGLNQIADKIVEQRVLLEHDLKQWVDVKKDLDAQAADLGARELEIERFSQSISAQRAQTPWDVLPPLEPR